MSQFSLTPEEQQLVVDAVRAKATQYLAMFGSSDPAMDALLDKLLGAQSAPVAEEAPAAEAPAGE